MLRMLNAEMAHKAAIKATKLGLSPKVSARRIICVRKGIHVGGRI